MVGRKVADFFETFLQEVFAHLLARDFTERGVEKSPVAFVQETARDIVGRLFPPYRNRVFDSVKKLQERERLLHEQCRKYRSDSVRIVRESADFSAAVDEFSAFFVDTEQNELEMLFAGGLIN